VLAHEEARRLGHNFVGTDVMLLGLIGEGHGAAAKALKGIGVSLKDARVEVEKIIGRGSGFVVSVEFTPRARRVLELARSQASERGHHDIGTGHVLLGIIRSGGEGVAVRSLENLGVDLQKLCEAVIKEVETENDT
jgi:ATP-dependent Clp protease ATP-binding subunit ClpC